MHKLIVGLILMCGCASPRSPAPTVSVTRDADMIGKTLGEAIEALGLTLEESPVIHEPPGVARGLHCLSPAKEEVSVYFRRGDAPFNQPDQWTTENLKRLRVIGITRREKDEWKIEGEVIWHFHLY